MLTLALTDRLFFGIMGCLGLLTVMLAITVTSWWWLLFGIALIISLIILAIRSIIRRIIRGIYGHPYSSTQRQELEEFTQKFLRLIEAHNTSSIHLAYTTIWEIIRYREARTIMRVIDDSLSLSTDYQNLQKYFGGM